jgi:SNF family Na+-dependent transporter
MAEGSTGAARRGSLHGLWSSRFAFILAVTGSAVGLGNIWKFPYVAGVNGGGAFVLVYLLCVFAIGLPIMMSEVLIGRRGRRNPDLRHHDWQANRKYAQQIDEYEGTASVDTCHIGKLPDIAEPDR